MGSARATDGQPGLSAGPQSCMVWQPSDKLSQVNQQYSKLDRAEVEKAFRHDRGEIIRPIRINHLPFLPLPIPIVSVSAFSWFWSLCKLVRSDCVLVPHRQCCYVAPLVLVRAKKRAREWLFVCVCVSVCLCQDRVLALPSGNIMAFQRTGTISVQREQQGKIRLDYFDALTVGLFDF